MNIGYAKGDSYDEYGDELYLVGGYVVRSHGNDTATRLMADVEFRYTPNAGITSGTNP